MSVYHSENHPNSTSIYGDVSCVVWPSRQIFANICVEIQFHRPWGQISTSLWSASYSIFDWFASTERRNCHLAELSQLGRLYTRPRFWKNMFFWWVNGHVRRSGGVNWVWVCCTQRRSWCWHPLCFFRFCLLGNINLHIWLPLLFFHTWEMRVLERQLTRANDPELELGVFMCFFSSPCFRNSFNEKVDKSFLPTCKLFLSQMPLLSDSRGIDTYLTIMQIGLTRENDPELEIFAPASSGCPCCEICNYTF